MAIWGDYSTSTKVSQSNIDTGTVTVDSFADTEGSGAIWKYVINKGSGANMRTGIIQATWNSVSGSTPAIFPDEYSDDIGITHGVVSFTVDKSGNTVRLRMTVTSDDWSFSANRTLIGES
jgi:hypothetical protein